MSLFGFWKHDDSPPWEIDLIAEAERLWAENKDMPMVGIYLSPFGEHKVFPIRLEDLDTAIEFLTKMRREND